VRLFLDRTFHGGDGSGAGEIDISLGLVLSLLAMPGALYSMLLFEKYSTLLLWMRGQLNFDPVAALVPDEYFFIVLSMVVTGAVAVWRWDALFPDRRDYMNLVPLPLSTTVIFLANLTAVLGLAAVLAVDVNAASALLFPLAASSGQETLRYAAQIAGMHVLVVVLASACSFFAVLATAGVLMVALPNIVFRRISIYLRGLIIVLLVGLLSTSFAIPSMIDRLPSTPVRFLPSLWFLGLAELIHGSGTPALSTLGWLALKALGFVIVIALAACGLSYRRYFARIPEMVDVSPKHGEGRLASWVYPLFDRWLLKTPFQKAAYRFVLDTLFRSERHSLVLAAFAGLALALASEALFSAFGGRAVKAGGLPPPEILSIPLIFCYCVIVGLRLAYDVPSDLPANWIFQLSVAKGTKECVPLARKIMLSLVLPWTVGISVSVFSYLSGWLIAGIHALVIVLFSVALSHLLLVGYRKVPFTCSYPPFKDSAIVMVLAYFLGFFVFVVFVSNLEYRALLNPFYTVPLLLLLAGAWFAAAGLDDRIADIDKQLIFEEQPPTGFELLDLEQRS
jgi:hypothetical protein